MTLDITVSGSSVSVTPSSLNISDKIDERSSASFQILDETGLLSYAKHEPVSMIDSTRGTLFSGYIQQAQVTRLYPNLHNLWSVTCIDETRLLDKRLSKRRYSNQYAGAIIADQIQRYGTAENVTGKFALRWDESTTNWSAGTLTGTHATTNASNGNIDAGDLELSLAGSDVSFSQSSQSDFNAGTTGGGLSSPASGGVQFTSTQAIKLQANQGIPGLADAFLHVKIWAGSYVFVSGDTVKYDVWISSASPEQRAAIDLACTDGTVFRNSNATTDSQNLSQHPNTDLTGLATDQWYSRAFIVGSDLIGKTLSFAALAFGGDSPGEYTAYFRNIYITNGATTKVTIFDAAATTFNTTPQQLQCSGYSDLSCSVITAYERTGYMFSPFFSYASAGVVKSSKIAWDVTLPNSDFNFTVTASIDGLTYLPCTNGGSIPAMLPGINAAGHSVIFAYTMSNNGNDPSLTPFLSKIVGSVQSSYSCSKSDNVTSYNTGTQWNTGTLSSSIVQDGNSIRLGGYARNFEDGFSGNQTLFGASSPSQVVTNRQFFLTSGTSNDARSRLDFAGNTWQDFTAEVDVSFPANSVQMGLVYRTTGWSNTNNTFAYMCIVQNTGIVLGHGTNGGANTFTSIASASLTLSTNTFYRLKLVISGNTHKVYLNEVLYITATDATYPAAGYLGLRMANGSASTQTGTFDNFGVVSALSGTWTSPAIDIHALSTISNSALNLEIDPGVNLTMCAFKAEISLNNGSTYTTLTNLQGDQSGYYQAYPVSGLTAGTNVSGMTQVRIRLTLSTTTASVGETQASRTPVLPKITAATLFVVGNYSSSGTRVSPALSCANVGRAETAIISWNANTPAGTTLTAETSINNGSTWQSATNGGAISGISTQPSAIIDPFSTNTSANYTQSNFAGVTGTWTWDTANSRLSGSGATNGTLVHNPALTLADSYALADLDECDGSGLIANYIDANNLYYVQIFDDTAGSLQNKLKLFKRASGTSTQLGTTVTITFTRGTKYRFNLDVQNGVLTVYQDGIQVIQQTDGSPLGAGKSGLYLNSLIRCYNLRIQQYGQNVSSLTSVKSRLTLSTTDPTVTPQVLDMQVFISSPDIGAGMLIHDADFYDTFVSDNVSNCAQQSDFWTNVRADKSIVARARNAYPAPWIIQDGDTLISGFSKTHSADLYRNQQTLKGVISTDSYTEIKTGDGSARTWTLAHPLAAPPDSLTLNGQTATFGIKNVDTGKQFYYELGSAALDQDNSGTLLTSQDSIAISYEGTSIVDLTISNTSIPDTLTISQLAAIDGSSGIVEAIEDVTDKNMSVDAATTYATQLLTRYGNIGRTIQFITQRANLAPGQELIAFIAAMELTEAVFLISEIVTTITITTGDTIVYWYGVTAIEGPNLGSWAKMLASSFR